MFVEMHPPYSTFPTTSLHNGMQKKYNAIQCLTFYGCKNSSSVRVSDEVLIIII